MPHYAAGAAVERSAFFAGQVANDVNLPAVDVAWGAVVSKQLLLFGVEDSAVTVTVTVTITVTVTDPNVVRPESQGRACFLVCEDSATASGVAGQGGRGLSVMGDGSSLRRVPCQ